MTGYRLMASGRIWIRRLDAERRVLQCHLGEGRGADFVGVGLRGLVCVGGCVRCGLATGCNCNAV